jgi:hypothetical protein
MCDVRVLMWADLCGSLVFLIWTGLWQDWIDEEVHFLGQGTLSRDNMKPVPGFIFPEQMFENMGYKKLKHPHWLIFLVTRGDISCMNR